jgi:hypothetical protein
MYLHTHVCVCVCVCVCLCVCVYECVGVNIFLEVLIMGHFMSFVVSFLRISMSFVECFLCISSLSIFLRIIAKITCSQDNNFIKIYILHFDANTNGIVIAIACL